MTLLKWKNDNFGVSTAMEEHAKYIYRTTNLHRLMAFLRFVAKLRGINYEMWCDKI
jgi:hypothetical protein